jgi:HlyD family secretion protein
MSARKWLLVAALVALGGAGGYWVWKTSQPEELPKGFVSSNGRTEATEIDIATKLAGRIDEILAGEGDFVTSGQVLARMNTDTLEAQLREAQAQLAEAHSNVETSNSSVKQRQSEKDAATSLVAQREAELQVADKNLARVENLARMRGSATSEHELDEVRARYYGAQAAVNAAEANVAAADAAITTARSNVVSAQAAVEAAGATSERIKADIDDSELKATRDGRVQFRIAQPGEVLPGGGKVLNMVDLADVYMTFFLPTDWSGRIKLGSEVRLVLDAAPEFVIPAKVTFVADVAQFTPKTVETAEERQKLTFRVKAHIPEELLKKYVRDVKTGLPGVAYVQLEPQAPWPAEFAVKLPNEVAVTEAP